MGERRPGEGLGEAALRYMKERATTQRIGDAIKLRQLMRREQERLVREWPSLEQRILQLLF